MNKEMGKNLNLSLKIIIVALLVLILGFLFFQNSSEKVYKDLLYADILSADASISNQKASDYYSEAGFFYESNDYKNVESNCRLARSSFSEANQKYLEAQSYLKDLDSDDKLIKSYIEMLGLISDTQINLYEACEHFESASRYYDTYYNTNVPYSDTSYDMGTEEIKAMNEKIGEHDNNVKRYNTLLSEFKIELKKRLDI